MLEPSLLVQSDAPDRLALRRFVVICIACTALCIALKPMTWFAPRAETDEQVNWTVARSLVDRGLYSLQGTGAIEALHLTPHTYDRPRFHHPPLFTYLLAPFAAARNPQASIMVSWLGHVLAIVGVALACWAWRDRASQGTEVSLWLPVFAMAVDPLMAFCSRKLWPDALLGGLDTLGLGLTVTAVAHVRAGWFIAAGTAFGLAAFTKLTGVLPAIPAMAWAFIALRSSRSRLVHVAWIALPIVLLVAPWLLWFRAHCGAWLPTWTNPPPEMIANVPHVARAVARPWHYYITQSALIAPITVACAGFFCISADRSKTRRVIFALGILAFVGITMTALGVRGYGLQMRYLTPGIGGLYLLLAAQLASAGIRRSLFPAIALTCIAFGGIQTGFYLQAIEFDEMVSLPEMARRAMTAATATRGVGG